MLRKALKRVLPSPVRDLLRPLWEFACSDLEGIVVEKDISDLGKTDATASPPPADMLEVSAEGENGAYFAGLKRRRGPLSVARARRYLKRGFRGVAAVRDGQVIGDVWAVTRSSTRLSYVHGDLRRLGIRLEEDEAYMFDMYIEPEHRGLALSTSLFRAAYRPLVARGVATAKGYYAVGNLPALWMHRVMGYREVGRVKVREILGMRTRYEFSTASKPEPRSAAQVGGRRVGGPGRRGRPAREGQPAEGDDSTPVPRAQVH